MASNIIPRDVKTWEEQVKRCYPDQDPASMSITSIGENQFSSASKLKYEDWLLLRVLWERDEGWLTHEAIFGRDDGHNRKRSAHNRLDNELWMKALDVEKDKEKKKDLLEWSWMAPWKLSVNDIGKRSPGASDLTSGKVYDDADPFRLVVEPFDPRGRPQRFINPDFAKLLKERENRNQLVDAHVRKTPSREESVASSRSHKSQSPSKSEELASVASSNVGSLRGRAGTSSPGSGASAEARMINKHRPDEALINMSLTLLLQGVCMSLLHTTFADSYSWSILHKQFSVSHPNPNSQTRTKILTARTDGCLQAAMAGQNADKGDTLAIVEVKPYRRHIPEPNAVALRIQEGAEMAAWISTECMKGLLPSPSGTQTYR
ncbi:hypothetical protein NM208_g15550 [Fusarium decemcellulare]|uniref:Uncharacterized protein n=1 Tax=Fusarium decemcellulare TaxID=57161 RepID=A0ACC1RDX6_9HYPO|nr:hypothetical protein NM208_g15550 [Fusarium decemcellulare]